MRKIAFIVISLVEESRKVANEQIEKEIYDEASIPWVKRIKKVTVLETNP